MSKTTLKAEKRDLTGRKVKRLRRGGGLPANIYGKKIKSQSISVDMLEFQKVFNQAGETNIVELMLGKEVRPTLIHNVQTDPVTDIPIHADFLQVNLKEKVTAQIPVELVNESPAEKQGLGTVVQYIDEIEVEALPTDLPERFELDSSQLTQVDDQFLVNDIKVDTTKVEMQNEPDQIIARVEPPKEEKEEVPAEPVEAEPAAEATEEKKEEEKAASEGEEEKKE